MYLSLAFIKLISFFADAMTSDRPYKKKRTYLQAIREIERCSGTQFDPYIAKVFISIIKENIDL